MIQLASRLNRIQPSPSSMANQRIRALKAEGRDIIGLTIGEPDFDTPMHIIEAAHEAAKAGKTKYPDVGGTPELREAVARKFQEENGLSYSREEIIVSTGAKQVIFNALMCTLNPGDEVIVPAPYWVSYPDIALLAEGVPVFVKCPESKGFKLQPEDLEAAITPRTRWLILNSPNNPSGATYSAGELQALGEVLRKHPQVWIMTDDIYEHLVFDGQPFATMAQACPDLKERTLTVNGVSKTYAMTGWRIGYGATPAALTKAMVKLQSQSTSGACTVSQAAALMALTGPQDMIASNRRIFQDRRDLAVGLLRQIEGLRCAVPQGAFYIFVSCEGLFGLKTPNGTEITSSDQWVMHLLDAQNVAVLQGSAYGIDTHFRISFAASHEHLTEAIGRIAKARLQLQR